MASTPPPASDSRAGRRRHSRLRVCLPARLITLDGTLHAVLHDVSFRGAKVSLQPCSLRPGSSAVLAWGRFEAFCDVAWIRDGMCGLDFEKPLKPDVLIATRDLADAAPRIDTRRDFARDWSSGQVSR